MRLIIFDAHVNFVIDQKGLNSPMNWRYAIKWFKHLSGSLNNSIIAESIEHFGGDGYLVFFGILEMLSDEFDIHNPGKLTIRMKKITKNLQLSRQKTVKILRFFDEKAKENLKKDVSFFADIGKVDVVINCKRLAMLCDNHTQKLLKDTSKLLQSENEVTSLQEEEEEGEGEVSLKEDTKNCPHLKIIEIYHKKLPVLPVVQNLSEDLKKRIRIRWKEDPQRQNLEWWEWYFQGVSECDFLVGKVKDWSASFYWLTGPKNMTKVLNGEYLNRDKSDLTPYEDFINER